MDMTLLSVREFHKAFDLATADEPTLLNSTEAELRIVKMFAIEMAEIARALHDYAEQHSSTLLIRLQLCQEELAELAQAMADEDMVECLDALCDMRYVADGAALVLGLGSAFMPAFSEVHSSNMSKLDEDGKPIINPAGRVVKGPLYRRPELARFVK